MHSLVDVALGRGGDHQMPPGQGGLHYPVLELCSKGDGIPSQWTLFQWGSKVSTNWSNTWEHACYCAFTYTFRKTCMFPCNVYMKAQ